METAHMYLFNDGCPGDWLSPNDGDETWHTIVNVVIPSDPNLWEEISTGGSLTHEKILLKDLNYNKIFAILESNLPDGKLKKWKLGDYYQESFCNAFSILVKEFPLQISACSYQENILRKSEAALLQAYNKNMGGPEGRGIGFSKFTDEYGRKNMIFNYMTFDGLRKIDEKENKLLPLLLMAYFISDQYAFYYNDVITKRKNGFKVLEFTVVSDKISGDNSTKATSLNLLKLLMNFDAAQHFPIRLAYSTKSDTFPGELLADNIAGWLTESVKNPNGKFAKYAYDLIPTGVWTGWNHLLPSTDHLKVLPTINSLQF